MTGSDQLGDSCSWRVYTEAEKVNAGGKLVGIVGQFSCGLEDDKVQGSHSGDLCESHESHGLEVEYRRQEVIDDRKQHRDHPVSFVKLWGKHLVGFKYNDGVKRLVGRLKILTFDGRRWNGLAIHA